MSQLRTGHNFIRPEIRNQRGMPAVRVDPTLHRLQWNENPFDFPADLKEEVLQRLARVAWSRYPEGLRAYGVIEAVAKANNLPVEQVVVGSGSGDILRVIHWAILQQGDHLLTLTPTFGSYANHGRLIGAHVHTIALDPANGFALPVDAILEQAAQHDVKLITICAPNNPTGTIFPPEQLRRIVLESDAFVFIDAAYSEFCDQDLHFLLAESDRVAISHTLSKAYALAGVRIGYALAAPEIAQELQKLVVNFTLNPLGENAAIVALENKARFRPLIDAIVAERERLADALAQLPGVTVFPSGTNSLFVNLAESGKAAQEYLRTNQRVLLAEMGMYPGFEEYVRISIGAPAENDLVINGLRDYLATTGA